MDSSTLNSLLHEYEQKRIKAHISLDERKKELFLKYPDLADIENEINLISIKKINLILSSNSTEFNNINSKIDDLKKQKNQLLKKYNIKPDFFKPLYECNICEDTGYIKKNNKSVMCSCLKQKLFDLQYNKCNIGNLACENFSTFSLDYYSDEVNAEKYGILISPRENIKRIKDLSINFINNFDNPQQKNLLFTGETGLGKTFLCNCIADELLHKGKTVLYQTAPVMIDSIINYRFSKTPASNNIIDHILNVDLLIIDDLGTETLNTMKLTELFTIINSRILNQNNKITKTIISTNLSLQDLFSVYNERIGSRFIGHYDIFKFVGDDIRFKKKL